ncbi:MAG: LLM class flavin-dependent oxidoreductase [Actinobacteria bacterium]|nr:LLM class flavin-dependent oxidoreductase [Actinomycetota bacterium]
MRLGVYVNTQDPPGAANLDRVYNEVLEIAEAAEAAGFDACFLPEHHQQPDGYLPAPLVMAGAVLARTTRIDVHTGILVLPLWDPMRVAEDVATLDVLSGGRMHLGVALGLVQAEFDQFGVRIEDAVGRFEESVEILKRAWSDEPVSFDGEHFAYDGIDVQPKPRGDRPRIWIGGMSGRAVDRAARIGDGWITDPLHNKRTMQVWADRYRSAAAAAGTTPRIWLQRDLWVTEDPSEIGEHWAPHLVADWRFYHGLGFFNSGRFNPRYETWLEEIQSPEDITFDRLRDDRVVVGTPEQVAAELADYARLIEPEGICFRLRFPHGPDHARTVGAVELFGREVIPALAGSAART